MKKNIFWFFLFILAFGFSQVTKSAITCTVKSSTGETLAAGTVKIADITTTNANIRTINRQGTNGVAHIIDKVLQPTL